jgi:plasmid stability protein
MPYRLQGCRQANTVGAPHQRSRREAGFERALAHIISEDFASADLHGGQRYWYAINAISDIIDCMASITIRRLPEATKRRLRIRAAQHGRSMEQEARELLETELARADAEPENLGEAIRRRFAPLGGVDLKIPPRRGKIRKIQFK